MSFPVGKVVNHCTRTRRARTTNFSLLKTTFSVRNADNRRADIIHLSAIRMQDHAKAAKSHLEALFLDGTGNDLGHVCVVEGYCDS